MRSNSRGNRPAREAGRVFRIPAAFIERELRIWTNQTFAHFLAVLVMTHDELIRRLPGPLPLLDERKRVDVEVFRSSSTHTVAHAWNHEEAHGFTHRLRAGLGDH